MTEYANPDVLVSTDWLEGQLDDPDVRVIEVDEDTTAYEKGHIRGAVGWNWTTDLHTPVGRDYLDQGGFAELLSGAGVGSGTTVVLYGGNNNWFAAYAYWLLKLRGFDDVKLLDGGRKKWELESREQTQEVPRYPATDLRIDGPAPGEQQTRARSFVVVAQRPCDRGMRRSRFLSKTIRLLPRRPLLAPAWPCRT